jgi:hypothetical protein
MEAELIITRMGFFFLSIMVKDFCTMVYRMRIVAWKYRTDYFDLSHLKEKKSALNDIHSRCVSKASWLLKLAREGCVSLNTMQNDSPKFSTWKEQSIAMAHTCHSKLWLLLIRLRPGWEFLTKKGEFK